MVLRELPPLIVPPADILYAFGDEQLKHLIGLVNQNGMGAGLSSQGRPHNRTTLFDSKNPSFHKINSRS